jgi:predicted RNase H-like HicB family nuclease
MFKDKIKLNTANFYNNQTEREIKLINEDQELLNTYTIGIREFRAILWHDKLAQVEKYIKENGKLPSSTDKNIHIKSLHYWINDQKRNYKNNKQIMKNKEIRIEWEYFINKYEELFRNNKEVWKDKLNKIKDYIKENGKLPSRENKNDNIRKLLSWIVYQKMNYKYNKEIMKNKEIKKEWKDFINNYQVLLKNNKEIWNDNLKKIEDYIKENGKLPSRENKNEYIKTLSSWIFNQKNNYKYNQYIMKNEEIKKEWEDFINKYQELFKTNKEVWKDNLIKAENYINNNNKLPSLKDKNQDIKSINVWITCQKRQYKNNSFIMKDQQIRKEWENFMKKYEKYFK